VHLPACHCFACRRGIAHKKRCLGKEHVEVRGTAVADAENDGTLYKEAHNMNLQTTPSCTSLQ
jgi:hypothetical protein